MPLGAGSKKLVLVFNHWVDGFEEKKIKQQQVLWECG